MSDGVLIPIVNEHDEIIAYKPRGQIGPNDIYRASMLWVTNSQGEVLLSQRAFTKKRYPGIWSVAVAGTVENNETYEETIIREAYEEIGLQLAHAQPFKKYLDTVAQPLMCMIFKVTIDQLISYFTRQIDEVEQLAWVPYDTFIRELVTNPDKYVPMFPGFLEQLKED